MPLFARRAMAFAGPLTANGQTIACPKCGGVTNHQILQPKRHTDPHAVIRCRSGHQFTNPLIPASVINRVKFADEGKVQVHTKADNGQAVIVKGVVAKDSMAADPKGVRSKSGALQKGAAATAAKTGKAPAAPAATPVRRAGGGSSAFAASLNVLAAGINTVGAAVGTVGTVAGAVGQVAGAVGATATAAAKVGGEGLGLARDGVKVGKAALDGKIKSDATERAHTEAQRVRQHQATEAAAQRADAAQTRADQRAEAQRVRAHKATEAAAARQHKADEAARLRTEKAAEAGRIREFKATQAQVRREGAEAARRERIARRRSAGQLRRKRSAAAPAGESVRSAAPSVDLTEYDN